MAPGRFTKQSDSPWIDFVPGGIRLNKTDGRFHVVRVGRKLVLRGESIVDAEPRESRVGKRLENICDVLLFVPRYPSSPVHEHRRRKRANAFRNVRIHRQPNPIHLGELHILKVSRPSGKTKSKTNQNATTNVGHTEPHARHFVENRPPRGNWPSHKMALHHVRCYVVHESTLERASTLARVCRGVSRNQTSPSIDLKHRPPLSRSLRRELFCW